MAQNRLSLADIDARGCANLAFVARPLRLDYPGAIHHVFVRGVARSAVAVDDADYECSLFLLERTLPRFGLRCHAWCYLPNHSHLLVTSEGGNLSRAMHWLGTCTAQSFNQRHQRSGHLYQGRYGSRLVGDDSYLLELARYLPLNPVNAGLCSSPEDWPWSSYAATAGLDTAPAFLDTATLLGMLGSPEAYAAWVADGVLATGLDERGVPRPPPRPTLASLLVDPSERAIATAHFRHGYSKAAIARHLGISRCQVRNRLAPAT
jgi:REP element-mobilizing transposase RayT